MEDTHLPERGADFRGGDILLSADQVQQIAYRLMLDICRKYPFMDERWAWSCDAVKLTTGYVVGRPVPLYEVRVTRWRRPGTFVKGGRWRCLLQIDPESGRLVGFEDEGVQDW
jgi:hypothetical protein